MSQIPTFAAIIDSYIHPSTVKSEYITGNWIYNTSGAMAAMALLFAVVKYIRDYSHIRNSFVMDYISLVTPLSFFIAMLYQYTEQMSDVKDHSPLLTNNINQGINLIYLVYIYHVVFVLFIFLFANALYKTKYNDKEKAGTHITILFFYFCAFNDLIYIKLIFSMMTPVIIVYAVFLMFLIRKNNHVPYDILIFMFVHTVLYLLLSMKVTAKFLNNETQIVFLICIIIVIVINILLGVYASTQVNQIKMDEAKTIIIYICSDSKGLAEHVLQMVEKTCMVNHSNQCDYKKFIHLLIHNLHNEMLSKGLLNEGENDLPCDQLLKRIAKRALKENEILISKR